MVRKENAPPRSSRRAARASKRSGPDGHRCVAIYFEVQYTILKLIQLPIGGGEVRRFRGGGRSVRGKSAKPTKSSSFRAEPILGRGGGTDRLPEPIGVHRFEKSARFGLGAGWTDCQPSSNRSVPALRFLRDFTGPTCSWHRSVRISIGRTDGFWHLDVLRRGVDARLEDRSVCVYDSSVGNRSVAALAPIGVA